MSRVTVVCLHDAEVASKIIICQLKPAFANGNLQRQYMSLKEEAAIKIVHVCFSWNKENTE